MLEACGVSFSYGEDPVLQGVSFSVAPGELVALVGGNGSGKSTLGRLLAGALLPEAGSVVCEGFDSSEPDSRPEVRRMVGLVVQNPADQLVSTVVADEVGFGPQNLGLSAFEVGVRVDAALEAVGLAGCGTREVNALSGGEQQRLALAGVLAMEPAYLVLDEALSMVDSAERPQLRALVRRLARERGIGVVMVTHDPIEALGADRVVVLKEGRVSWSGEPDTLVRNERKLLERVLMTGPYERALCTAVDAGYRLASGVEPADLAAWLAGEGRGACDAVRSCLRDVEAGDVRDDRSTDEARVAVVLLLSAKGLSVGYGGRAVLHDVSLALAAGTVTLMAGESGAGKSTLATVLAGLAEPLAGSVAYAGEGRPALAFQQPENQLFLESVEAELAFGPRQLGCDEAEVRRRVGEAAEALGLNEELRKAQKSCSDELEAVADAQNDLNKARSMAQGQKTVAQSYFQSAAKKLESVSSRILIADWKRVWATDPVSLERTIREKSEKYAQAVELKESLENSRKDISTLIGTFSQMAESVCGKFPKWRQISGERAGQVSEPFRRRWAAQMAGKGSRDFRLEEWKPFFEPRWANLLSMTASLSAEKGAAEKGLAKERGNVEEFFRLHQDVGTERVGWLMSNLTEESAGAIAEKLKSIDTALEKARTEYAQVEAGVRAHELSKPELRDGDTVETLESGMRDADSRRTLEDRKVGAIEASLRLNEQNLLLRRSDQARLHDLEEEYQRWKSLNAMFGSADGSRFRGIAQAFILKQLLMCANHYLKHFSPRYELDCQPGSVGIVIRDLYQGDAVRPYSTLSGGEGFIVSLALALGLSAMTRGNASVDVLFIDEGFGTLSEDYLNTVIDTLSRLHETGGRKVGIISHVDILRERIPAQIRLLRENNTASRVEVVRL